ncbi:MAG: DUF11 domain-containing protein [Rudaea sp.]|nr:DUF11 domain-containing protein [Rudaea sp.]MBR0346327.1 DUF11 domain-containing protein [Rudaea sp.]
MSKQFSPSTIASGGTSTLTITIANTAPGAVNLTGIGLTDNLPSGVSIASPPNSSTTCGAGLVSTSIAAGITSVTLTGGSVSAGASCAISVNVTAP